MTLLEAKDILEDRGWLKDGGRRVQSDNPYVSFDPGWDVFARLDGETFEADELEAIAVYMQLTDVSQTPTTRD
jgi:hypothetical protein